MLSRIIDGNFHLKATNWGKILCLGPQVVVFVLQRHISIGSEINDDWHDDVGISLLTPVGGLMDGPLMIGGSGKSGKRIYHSPLRGKKNSTATCVKKKLNSTTWKKKKMQANTLEEKYFFVNFMLA